MASLLKNQIIKRLSKLEIKFIFNYLFFCFFFFSKRFVKNLSPNQINISTLKGEGELSSIDLDEQAIEDVIELPR